MEPPGSRARVAAVRSGVAEWRARIRPAMRLRRLALVLLLYTAMDFANPLMAGAVTFTDGTITVVQADRSAVVEIAPVGARLEAGDEEAGVDRTGEGAEGGGGIDVAQERVHRVNARGEGQDMARRCRGGGILDDGAGREGEGPAEIRAQPQPEGLILQEVARQAA